MKFEKNLERTPTSSEKLASKNFYDGKNKIACKRAGEFPPALKIKDEKIYKYHRQKTASDNFLTKNLHLTFMKFLISSLW